MPATPTLRKSSRQARARSVFPAVFLPDTVVDNDKAARAKRNPRKYGKREKESDDVDRGPPVVQGQGLIPDVFASQATRELQAAKKDRDELIQEAARLKQEKNQLFPIVAAVREFLECPICCDYLIKPVTLRCGHTFCTACFNLESNAQKTQVVSLVNQEAIEKAQNFYSCPTCRAFTERSVAPNKIHGLRDIIVLLSRE